MTVQHSILIQAAARGDLKPSNLLNLAQANVPMVYNANSARFTKVKPGEYQVKTFKGEQETGAFSVTTPVEAKLMVIESVVDAAKQELKAA